jgi:aromatic ring-cleaving dioxygenase
MIDKQFVMLDGRMQAAVDELRHLIASRFPVVEFSVHEGEDGERIHLDAYFDMDETEEVLDLVLPRMVELQIDEGLPIVVLPMRTLERNAALLERQAQQRAALATA